MKNLLICIVLAVVASVALVGCWHKSDPRLACAEAVMESQPDSALRIVSAINPDEFSDARNRALFGLLSTQARVKCDIPIDDDSLIDASVGYFREHGPDSNLMKSLFYLGYVRSGLGMYAMAVEPLTEAMELAGLERDDYWAAKATEALGDIFEQAYCYAEAVNYTEKAAMHYLKAGKERNHLFSMCDLSFRKFKNRETKDGLRLIDSVLFEAKRDSIDKDLVIYVNSYRYAMGMGAKDVGVATSSMKELERYGYDFTPQDRLWKSLLELYKGNDAETARVIDSLSHRTLSLASTITYYKVLGEYCKKNNDLKGELFCIDTLIKLQNQEVHRVMKQSVSLPQRNYYHKFSEREAERANRTLHLLFVIGFGLIVVSVVVYFIIYKVKTAEINRKIADIFILTSQIEEQRTINDTLVETILTKEADVEGLNVIVENQKKNIETLDQRIQFDTKSQIELRRQTEVLFRQGWSTINLLCDRFVEYSDLKNREVAFVRDVEKELEKLRSPRNLKSIESSVNRYMDDIIIKLRSECVFLKEDDVKFITLVYAGLSPRTVSLMMDMKLKTYYTKRSRLIKRIQNAQVEHVDVFIDKFSK